MALDMGKLAPDTVYNQNLVDTDKEKDAPKNVTWHGPDQDVPLNFILWYTEKTIPTF